MFLQRMQYVVSILALLLCNAFALPSVEFIRQFAEKNSRSSITLHVPDETPTFDCVKR